MARLQKYREAADYGDAFFVGDEALQTELDSASRFVADIDQLNAKV